MPDLVPITTDQGSAVQQSTLRRVFFFDSELRAGWRLVLFIMLLIASGVAVSWLTSRFIPPLSGTLSVSDVIPNELRRLLVVLLASLVMARIERRTIGNYGLPGRTMFGKNFWIGTLWGFAMVSSIIGLMAASHSYAFGAVTLSLAPAIKYGLLWGLAFLAVGFAEEFSFRGYIQFTLTKGLG